jgi:hypothetical protein
LPLAAFAGRLIPVAVRRAPEPLHSTGTAAFQEEESGTAVYGIEGYLFADYRCLWNL